MHALISIHDVMPRTLARVSSLLEHMTHLPPAHITLLVVPGLGWTESQRQTLQEFEARGYILAGHGWHHTTKNIRGLYHRLHSLILSRRAAEHLALEEAEIINLMEDCFQWFQDGQLNTPDLYVPPAWAMGTISKEGLRAAPFRYYENTSGLYDSESGQQLNLPLVGFEADNIFRACSLGLWNALNRQMASRRRPVRISIHPFDDELLLRQSLHKTLQAVNCTSDYRSVF